MKQRPRIYYSDSQKALMWERWKQGWTLHEIGKLFDRAHSSIHRILAETGGIRPAQRARAATALTLAQREEISRAIVGASGHRCTTGTSTIDNLPGDQAQWWAPQLPGEPGRCSCVGPSEAPQVLQTRCEPRIGPNSFAWALGRRPGLWQWQQPDRDLGRASNALRDVDKA